MRWGWYLQRDWPCGQDRGHCRARALLTKQGWPNIAGGNTAATVAENSAQNVSELTLSTCTEKETEESMKAHNRRWMMLGLLVVYLLSDLLLGALSTPSAQAAGNAAPALAQISLVVTPADRHYGSIVQWQGTDGRWHNVDGWRREITSGTINWSVEEKDFGTGPFRWLVFSSDSGRPLAISQPFYLPTEGETKTFYVTLTPPSRSPEQPPHRQGHRQRKHRRW
jgi:hypothetical protein